jgi:ankyrin repeat protein
MKRTAFDILLPGLALLVGLGGGPSFSAPDPRHETRRYTLPNAGGLELSVPASWRQELLRPRDGMITVWFKPPAGDDFSLLVTLVTDTNCLSCLFGFDTVRNVRELVEQTGAGMVPAAAEKSVSLEPFDNSRERGYYVSLTDRTPSPAVYERVTHGAIAMGESLLSFTLLTHAKNDALLREVLDLVRNATRLDEAEAAKTPGRSLLALDGMDWQLEVDVKGWIDVNQQSLDDGRIETLRARRKETGTLATVTMTRYADPQTAESCSAQSDGTRLRSAAGAPTLVNGVPFVERPDRAFAVAARDSACIALRLTTDDGRPGEAALLATLLDGVRVKSRLATPLPAEKNLLQNPLADQEAAHWQSYGDAEVEETLDGNSVFAARNGGHFLQDVDLPPEAAGQFVLLIGRLSTQRINPNGAITGLPYLYGYLMNKDDKRINTYMQGGAMGYQGTAVDQWQTAWGIFSVPAGTGTVRFFLDQAQRANLPQNGSAALFDDLGLYLFPTRDQAQAAVETYRQRAVALTGALGPRQTGPPSAAQEPAAATELIRAAKRGDLPYITREIAAGTKPDARGKFGYTALIKAAAADQASVVFALLAAGADVNAQSDGVRTVFRTLDVYLLSRDPGVIGGRTALMEAAAYKHDTMVNALLVKGAKVNLKDHAGRTALMEAAKSGHAPTLQLLLDHKAEVNVAALNGRTALMDAAEGGHTDLVHLLLVAGADIKARAMNGKSVLSAAVESGRILIVEKLLDAGAAVNDADLHGLTPLMIAAAQGNSDIVALLLAHGADVSAKTDAGMTTSFYAYVGGNKRVIEMLDARESRPRPL